MITDIAETKTIGELCRLCEDAQADIDKAFGLLNSAHLRLAQIIEHPDILPRDTYDLEDTRKESHKIVRKQVWRRILDLSQVKSICSVAKAKEIDNDFHQNELPEITEQNVIHFLENIRHNVPDMFNEAITEVFNFLRPGKWCTHKTNSKFEIGPKVIIDWGMDTSYGMCRPSYHKEPFYRALDNVFHLLDGKGVSKYPNDFYTQLDQQARKTKFHDPNSCKIETEYFRCRWYIKGTLHIEFKRLDLVKELNKRAGGLNLKGQVA